MARTPDINRATLLISYTPLRTEVPWDRVFTRPLCPEYCILPRPSLDPRQEALHVLSCATGEAVVLIPGKRFDQYGTRHGQGGGWYDRFLSRTPSSWIRIGFCFSHQFSKEPLVRQSWDEPVDYVYVVGGDDTKIYETHARSGTLDL